MKRARLAQSLCIAILATSACSQQSDEASVETNATTENIVVAEDEQSPELSNLDSADLPPMIERSPTYRCADTAALYVDVLTDENVVLVRDSRQDAPTRLTRDEPGDPFTGEGRSLSGTGSQVSYMTPERPEQTCTEADV